MNNQEYEDEDKRLKSAYLLAKQNNNELAMVRILRELGELYTFYFWGLK